MIRKASKRISFLVKDFLRYEPTLCIERAVLYDEGYENSAHQSIICKRADAIANVLDHMTLYILPGELIAGNQASAPRSAPVFPEFATKWLLSELDVLHLRKSSSFKIADDKKEILRKVLTKWNGRNVNDHIMNNLSDEIKDAEKTLAIIHSGLSSGTGHMIIDYKMVIEHGVKNLLTLLQQKKEKEVSQEAQDFLDSGIIVLEAAIRFAKRYSSLATELSKKEKETERSQELSRMAEILDKVPENPANDLYEAVQSFFIVHTILNIETNGHSISPGRFDQYMYPYYLKEIAKGTSPQFIQELIDSLWIKFNHFNKIRDIQGSKCFDGYPLFQNVILGGINEEGDDVVNELSYICLEATAETRLPQPSLSVRISSTESDKFYSAAAEVAALGLGMPAFFNDHVIIPALTKAGYTLEEARQYGEVGCVEPQVPGTTQGFYTAGYVCLAKCVELVLHNGIDPITGIVVGPNTGELCSLKTFADFMRAYDEQVARFCLLLTHGANIIEKMHSKLTPSPFASLFIEDCVERCKSFEEGGARYNFSAVNAVGMVNAADSLASIKKIVYDEKTVSLEKLVEILDSSAPDAGFMSYLMAQPKYGNDDPYVDNIAADISQKFCDQFKSMKNARGGIFTVGFQSISTHIAFSEAVGNLPDGKRFGEVLADGGVSAAQGRDKLGPTALIKSVSCIDQCQFTNGSLFNIKLNPSVVQGKDGIEVLVSIIKACRDLGIGQVQFNVVSRETLLKAQKEPQKYANLVVRVAGFSVFFTAICRDLQEDIIRRTEHK